MKLPSSLCIAAFVFAAVAANVVVATFGQAALVFTAWVLIPFDMLARDVLHERWQGRSLWVRMAALILAGSAVTALLSPGSSRVALASFLAFLCAALTDTAAYEALRKLGASRFTRMNGSNVLSALFDSTVFPLVAFGAGATSLQLCAAQSASKFLGGIVWSTAFLWMSSKGTSKP